MPAATKSASTAPERSLAQRMEALNEANRIRTKRAQLKKDLRGGRANIKVLLLSPPDYIQSAKVKTLQGTVAFDANGDLEDRTISVFQIKKDANYATDDMVHQYHYIGVAPQS